MLLSAFETWIVHLLVIVPFFKYYYGDQIKKRERESEREMSMICSIHENVRYAKNWKYGRQVLIWRSRRSW